MPKGKGQESNTWGCNFMVYLLIDAQSYVKCVGLSLEILCIKVQSSMAKYYVCMYI